MQVSENPTSQNVMTCIDITSCVLLSWLLLTESALAQLGCVHGCVLAFLAAVNRVCLGSAWLRAWLWVGLCAMAAVSMQRLMVWLRRTASCVRGCVLGCVLAASCVLGCVRDNNNRDSHNNSNEQLQ
jgi:hypothetical protein